MLPKGYSEDNLVYDPWPMFKWLRTPLYKQDHMSANQDGIAYCGRDFWPPDEWWQANHQALGQEADYWVVVSQRKDSKCAACKDGYGRHLMRERDDNRGFWSQPEQAGDRRISLDGLLRLVKAGLV